MRALLAALLALAATGAEAQCRLALAMGLDVSSSVDAEEDRLQREGLARALLAPPVARAFLAGDPVAVYVFEWSGRSVQVPLLPGWVTVADEDDLERVAGLVVGSVRSRDDSSTAVGAALLHAAAAFGTAPPCRARTLDLASDGVGNDGPLPRQAYRATPWDGVTVNVLVIGAERAGSTLVGWYATEVLRGPGAFWIGARDFAGFQAAMEMKLLRELALPVVGKAGRAGAGQ